MMPATHYLCRGSVFLHLNLRPHSCKRLFMLGLVAR
eukprot:COSAG01_NODE_75063_length_198_cov_138.393939_1_plen_35_part_01